MTGVCAYTICLKLLRLLGDPVLYLIHDLVVSVKHVCMIVMIIT